MSSIGVAFHDSESSVLRRIFGPIAMCKRPCELVLWRISDAGYTIGERGLQDGERRESGKGGQTRSASGAEAVRAMCSEPISTEAKSNLERS